MESSPLTQQDRPQVFHPKIHLLYSQLLQDNEEERPDGFWTELFILKPDFARFEQLLDHLDPSQLLRAQHQTQQFVSNVISTIGTARSPADEHALRTFTVFLNRVLSKRFLSPSADIIHVLAGLDDVDFVFSDLVSTLESAIAQSDRPELSRHAVQVCIALGAGAFNTSLLAYFTQRDLFTPLMQLVQRADEPSDICHALILSAILANYNKFEMHNSYQTTHANLSSRPLMAKISRSIGSTCDELRDHYVAIQNDLAETWTLGGALGYLGLGPNKNKPPVLSVEETRRLFTEQPQREAAVLLALYGFVLANHAFRIEFVTQPPAAESKKPEPAGVEGFLSLTSYMSQHAHRSSRAASYVHLALMILQVLLEDSVVAKRLSTSSPAHAIRLCRQRAPHLPIVASSVAQPLAATVLDLLVDCLNHNLRTNLDVTLYSLTLATLSRQMHVLSSHRTKIVYHWSELWRSLLSLVRFLTRYAPALKSLDGTSGLATSVAALLTTSLTRGEAFNDDTDDLCYKIAASSQALYEFKTAFFETSDELNVLVDVAAHLTKAVDDVRMLEKAISPARVMSAIRRGYETLDVQDSGLVGGAAAAGSNEGSRFYELDHLGLLRRIVKVVVGDATNLVSVA